MRMWRGHSKRATVQKSARVWMGTTPRHGVEVFPYWQAHNRHGRRFNCITNQRKHSPSLVFTRTPLFLFLIPHPFYVFTPFFFFPSPPPPCSPPPLISILLLSLLVFVFFLRWSLFFKNIDCLVSTSFLFFEMNSWLHLIINKKRRGALLRIVFLPTPLLKYN